jgi:CubicO group peptidase (beta-lactamase class C family)
MGMSMRRTVFIGTALLLAAAQGASAQVPPVTGRAHAAAAIDSIARAAVDGGRIAGLSVGVVVGGDTLVLRGYGRADVELDVPTPDRAVYEIGSVTKQFTAAAILQLRDRGLIDLDADISEYLPHYDTQGRRVPVRRLLDHTSGIRGYTELEAFRAIAPRALHPDTLVRMFQVEPFDFEPGTALIYNNSAYFLLGLIIERVSVQTYADYVKEHLFGPAGMPDSRYCSNTEIVPLRAKGYTATPAGLRRADHIDHMWPYAAGSLCSTAGDLIAWTQALHGGRVLGADAYRELITPDTLIGGVRVRYAKGLSISTVAGQAAISHGGGIPGFLSDLVYLPEHDAIVTVLINTTGPTAPGAISAAIIRTLFGEPAPLAAVPFTGSLPALSGTYQGAARGASLTVRIEADGDTLQLRLNDAQAGPRVVHVGEGVFRAGNMLLRFVEEHGRVVRVILDQGAGVYVLTRQ